MTHLFPDDILRQHMAFLGKTGSGKTSTAKLAVEQIVRENPQARVCVLDPIKSDWWGLTSSADGRQPGLPFYILGGPRGHVPLHDSAGKAIGELVASGDLPLSIIDMAEFGAGGLQKFFNDFAPALMKRMRGVVYLVIEEAHEFAPKERSGIGAESLAIHNAKKLATAGRSKGIRMMVLTQRTQALHNALLGSCDTMIAHRLTAPADQEPVKKWLKANVSKELYEKVSASLSSLKTGSGWICSGEAQVADLVQFPKITTYDNSATPTGDTADVEIRTAPVDRDRLRAIIGDAVAEAEQHDEAKLREKIAQLEHRLAGNRADPSADAQAVREAEERGFERGKEAVIAEAKRVGQDAIVSALSDLRKLAAPLIQAIDAGLSTARIAFPDVSGAVVFSSEPATVPRAPPSVPPRSLSLAKPAAPPDGSLTGAAPGLLAALARGATSWEHAAVLAGIIPGNGYFYKGRKALIDGGLVMEGEPIEITAKAMRSIERKDPPRLAEIVTLWSNKLRSPGDRILQHLAGRPDRAVGTDDLAAAIGAKSGNGYWYKGVKVARDANLIEQLNGTFRLTEFLRSAPR